jgi:hypothetical protein
MGNRGAKDMKKGTLGQLIYRLQRLENKDESHEDRARDRGQGTWSRAMRQGTKDQRQRTET